MGAVWRAKDRRTGERVALKVLAESHASHARRFLREATLLSGIDHPGIVGHVAHGTDKEGLPWLAMQWLDGEDLAAKLTRGRLDPDEVIALGLRLCDALAQLHGRDVVHRDIKPHNVFLCDGRADRAVLLDLGVARHFARDGRITSTNEVVGTVGYLAPEQVEETEPLSGATDMFALGCVLYESLVGEAAFTGPHPLAVLTKLLLFEPPPIFEKREDVPGALADLVHTLLIKEPARRPSIAQDVRRALLEIERGSTAFAATQPPPSSSRIGASEVRVVTFLLIEPRAVMQNDATKDLSELLAERDVADQMAAAAGARLRWSNDGLAFAVVDRGETPGDRAARSAWLALELSRLRWVARVLVSTGRALGDEVLPPNPVVDRAAAKARDAEGPEGAFVDGATEALLSGEVVLAGLPTRRRIVARGTTRLSRTILGKSLPCLGRSRELAVLDGIWTATVREQRAAVALVTGPAGVGKSRLVAEWVARLDAKVFRAAAAADPVHTGTLGLVGDLVRAAIQRTDLDEATPREALARHASDLSLSDPRVVAFLGELASVGDDTAPSAALRAARSDPRVHAEWLERAFLAWLERLTEQPLLIVVEDLPWADEASVGWLDRALRRFENRPWLVLATSRPNLDDRFPLLWEDAAPQRIALGALSERAAKELVEIAAGNELDADMRKRVVERANGHPFLLEELLRHVVHGGPSALPDSVLAMVQLRLGRLASSDRRLLRLASVLGERFSDTDLKALAGTEVQAGLASLERAEVVGPEPEPGRWAFRHALVREAAYESMVDEDRRRAHEAAAAALETRSEQPEVVARHFEAAGKRTEAAAALVLAARRALERGVPSIALALADRAAPLAEDPILRARAWAYASGAASMSGDLLRAATLGADAMAALSPEREEWFMAAYGPCLASYQLDSSRVPAVTRALLETDPGLVPPTILSAYAFSACILVLYGVSATRPVAQEVVRVARAVAESHGFEGEPFLRPLQTVLAVVALREGDVAEGRRHGISTLSWCEAIGADGLTHMAQVFSALAAIEVGRGTEALVALEGARNGLYERQNLQMGHFGLSVEIRALAAASGEGYRAALDVEAPAPTPYHEGWYATQRATLVAATGEVEEARRLTARYVGCQFPLFDGFARSLAARAAAEGGRFTEALEHIEAFDALSRQGQTYPLERSWADVVRVRALRALGRNDEAQAALVSARARIRSTAARLDVVDSAAYEEAVVPNREILAMDT